MNIKQTLFGAVLGIGLLIVVSSQAAVIQTTKGDRLSVSGLATPETVSFKSEAKANSCPMMKKSIVTTVRDVDSKGHVTVAETGVGISHEGCSTVQQRDTANQVQSVMVCPDGSAQPMTCCKH